jgi:hypothetical protein
VSVPTSTPHRNWPCQQKSEDLMAPLVTAFAVCAKVLKAPCRDAQVYQIRLKSAGFQTLHKWPSTKPKQLRPPKFVRSALRR